MTPTATVIDTAQSRKGMFTKEFMDFLSANVSLYQAFEAQALEIVRLGFKHYSARTIIHYMRHHTALTQRGGGEWKINNNVSPYMARLFSELNPKHADLFEYRVTKAVAKSHHSVNP